jgi:RecA-family ATPase
MDDKNFGDFADIINFPPEKMVDGSAPLPLETITPAAWKGTKLIEECWFAFNRILGNDLAILAGDGGAGKTEIALQLCVHGAAGLGDWLGGVIEEGPALFFSAEEQQRGIRKRLNRICKNRGVEPDNLHGLHLHFPDLEETFLVTSDKNGKLQKLPLMDRLEKTIARLRPALVVIDNVAAVYDGEAMSRRQVRRFCAMLRKIAQNHDTAIMLLDHPSLRGMADGTGTANSVDWRNSARSMLYLTQPDRNEPDERLLEVMKMNDGRAGEKVKVRWNGTTFTTEATAGPSPQKAKAERDTDDLFLQLLNIAAAQNRYFSPSPGISFAPTRLAEMPQAKGIHKKTLAAAMERLFAAERIKVVPNPTKPESKASGVIVPT